MSKFQDRAPKAIVRPVNTDQHDAVDPHDLNPTQSVGKMGHNNEAKAETNAPTPAAAPLSNIVWYEGLDAAMVIRSLWDHLALRANMNVLQMPNAVAETMVLDTEIEYTATIVMILKNHDPKAMTFNATEYNRFFDASGQSNVAQIVINGLRTNLEVAKPK